MCVWVSVSLFINYSKETGWNFIKCGVYSKEAKNSDYYLEN